MGRSLLLPVLISSAYDYDRLFYLPIFTVAAHSGSLRT